VVPLQQRRFVDPDPWQEVEFTDTLHARRAIADQLSRPLGELDAADREFISDLLGRTLNKEDIQAAVTERFHRRREPC